MSTRPAPTFSPDFAVSYRDMLLPAIAHERKTTRRVIQAIPDKNHDYRPDPKSRTALELATHIVESDVWFLNGLANLNFAWDPEKTLKPFTSVKDVLAWYDQNFQRAYDRVMDLSANQLLTVVDFFGMKMPLFSYILFALTHAVHHRGQLATYLRPMGGKVPDIYGGSADEPWQG